MSNQAVTYFKDKDLYNELRSIYVCSILGGIAPFGHIDADLNADSYPTFFVNSQRYDAASNNSVVSSTRQISSGFTQGIK